MLARVQGFEPQSSEPESDVLPLDDTRKISILVVLCYFCAVNVSREIGEFFIVNYLDEEGRCELSAEVQKEQNLAA